MSTCAFFGHRNAGETIAPELRKTIIELIENKKVTHFLIGNNGNFDVMVRRILDEELPRFPDVKYEVVLAYLPKNNEYQTEKRVHSVYPEGLESVPPKFAISKRNLWIIEQSDYVVTYVLNSYGGAAKSKDIAKKKNKRIIELSQNHS